jgi:hypothetical protein
MLNDSRCDPGRADSTLLPGEPDPDVGDTHHKTALLCAIDERAHMVGAGRRGVKNVFPSAVRLGLSSLHVSRLHETTGDPR